MNIRPLKGAMQTPFSLWKAMATVVCGLTILLPLSRAEEKNGSPAVGLQCAYREQSPLARVGATTITEEEVDRYIGREAVVLKRRLEELRRRAIDDLIDEKLIDQEAKRRGVSKSALVTEIAGAAPSVDPAEVDRTFLAGYDALHPLGDVIGRYRAQLDSEDRIRTDRIKAYLPAVSAAQGGVREGGRGGVRGSSTTFRANESRLVFESGHSCG